MLTFLIVLTILNSLLIIVLFMSCKSKFYFRFSKEKAIFSGTLLGYTLRLWKRDSEYSAHGVWSVYFKIRNKEKTEKNEEIHMMINKYSEQHKRQSLNAKFSWLETMEEVKQFEKDYSCVDNKFVSELVSNFKMKTV
jgi:hypothetical protein